MKPIITIHAGYITTLNITTYKAQYLARKAQQNAIY